MAAILMRAVKPHDIAATIVPIQINVHSGGPMVPGVLPDSGPQNPTSGPNP